MSVGRLTAHNTKRRPQDRPPVIVEPVPYAQSNHGPFEVR